MASPPALAEAQRWLQHAVLAQHPPSQPVEDMLTASSRLGAAQRLGVYRRGYRLRLLQAMRGLHPGLRALLGPELFDDFALDYLDACPSGSYTLQRLDERFAGHLAAGRPDREQPVRLRETWIDVMIDLARYERVFAEVYDGPGTEGTGIPTWTGPLESAPELLGRRVLLAPCLRVLRLCAPVHTYLAAVRRGRRPEPPAPRPVWLAVSRRDYVVTATEIASDSYQFLAALLGGAAVRVAAVEAGMDTADAVNRLRGWAANGWARGLARAQPFAVPASA
ncbi:DNA-binding domain-containing protein [Streptantibioticus ferralitis]|uniref:DNA-binding domain-containing protein n=1 Tax=Streptantibioticus ferralitis TaxID=236510 RepID=A0ABT5YTU5_9ACTN|nr:DNA-binding domain-containing protein [Streptantibioticus ferralitis]MDF2255023.1 DNA-binding domain-containing protein [Streptantibioticus ferralitis]